MPTGLSLTLNEAGYVVEQSATAINRAVDRGVIKATLHRRGKSRFRGVGPAELRFLAIAGEFETKLTPAGRKAVYEAIRRLPGGANRIRLGVMEFTLGDADRRIAARLQQLQDLKSEVEAREGADPVLRGCEASVYEIEALTRGQTIEEIIEDYPGLKPRQIEIALEYAKVYPKTGRPLPKRSLKRMLGDMADSGAWHVASDEVSSPRLIP